MRTRTAGILSYLLIAFGGAWTVWILLWLLGVSAIRTSLQFQLLSLPAEFAPALAAIIVRLWVGREGFADAGLKVHLRRKWRHYVFALVMPLFVVGAIVALAGLLRVDQPDFSLQRALRMLSPGLVLTPGTLMGLLLSPVILALVQTPILWGEEFGWRGYLQIRLLQSRPLLAAVATGGIWGVWHAPAIVLGYEQYSNVLLGLVTFPVLTVLLSILFGWLRARTGSIWSASLAHAAYNSIGGTFTGLLFLGGADFTLVGSNGILAWIPLGAICAWIVFTGQLKPETAPPALHTSSTEKEAMGKSEVEAVQQ
jgi:membrane protease YdiL (CAAX protease family)